MRHLRNVLILGPGTSNHCRRSASSKLKEAPFSVKTAMTELDDTELLDTLDRHSLGVIRRGVVTFAAKIGALAAPPVKVDHGVRSGETVNVDDPLWMRSTGIA